MSKSFWLSEACTPITSRSGAGCRGMLRNCNDAYAKSCGPPMTVGGWTRRTSGLRASGSIYIGQWIRAARRSTSSSGAKRDAGAAERFLSKALGGENRPPPRVINTDKDAAYPPAIVQLKSEAALEENCCHRPVQYLNNVLEQDHRPIKRRVRASQHFRSFWGAWRTIAGYEAIHMIRKGQAWGSAAGAKVGMLHRFILGLFAAN